MFWDRGNDFSLNSLSACLPLTPNTPNSPSGICEDFYLASFNKCICSKISKGSSKKSFCLVETWHFFMFHSSRFTFRHVGTQFKKQRAPGLDETYKASVWPGAIAWHFHHSHRPTIHFPNFWQTKCTRETQNISGHETHLHSQSHLKSWCSTSTAISLPMQVDLISWIISLRSDSLRTMTSGVSWCMSWKHGTWTGQKPAENTKKHQRALNKTGNQTVVHVWENIK